MTDRSSVRTVSLVALFAALTAVFGLIPKIDLPFGVPITAQTLAVMLAGCLLGPVRGFLALALFLLGVALGLPLLSGGRGGVAAFMAPSAGFLIGWPFGALVAGAVMRLGSGRRPRRPAPADGPRATTPAEAAGSGRGPTRLAITAFLASIVGGIGVVYACGIAGLVVIVQLTPGQAAAAAALFIPGDLIKAGVCALLVREVARGLPDWSFGGRAPSA